jgi:hypothetical protein
MVAIVIGAAAGNAPVLTFQAGIFFNPDEKMVNLKICLAI